mgnify:CR=1 FL=1
MKMRTPCIEDRRREGSNVPSTLIFPSCTGFPTWSREIFLDTYFRRYEITCLKNIVQAILSDSPTLADVSDYEEAFAKHSAFPLKKAASADSMETLVSVLSDTPYGDVLRKVAGSGSTTLFDYEFALDMFYFRDLWKRVRKN